MHAIHWNSCTLIHNTTQQSYLIACTHAQRLPGFRLDPIYDRYTTPHLLALLIRMRGVIFLRMYHLLADCIHAECICIFFKHECIFFKHYILNDIQPNMIHQIRTQSPGTAVGTNVHIRTYRNGKSSYITATIIRICAP